LPNPLPAHCRGLVKTFSDTQPTAPALWAYATTSAIAKTFHFGQITEVEGRLALAQLESLGVQLFVPDADQNLAAFEWTLRLKRAAAYDSYYLALAQTLKCDFWTADGRLFRALKDEHLKWLRWIEEISALE
jgi:predicted nucleic acid-binding protein